MHFRSGEGMWRRRRTSERDAVRIALRGVSTLAISWGFLWLIISSVVAVLFMSEENTASAK